MNTPTEEKKIKARSPNFPFIPLNQAITRAHQFYQEEKKSNAPLSRVALHWNYSINSSGLLQTAAALKQYGLVTDDGARESRRLKLTEMALRILLDERSNSIERKQYLSQAALFPPVAAIVYRNWPEHLPAMETLTHFLVFEIGFQRESAQRVAKILQQNEDFVGPMDLNSLSPGAGIGEVIESKKNPVAVYSESFSRESDNSNLNPALPQWGRERDSLVHQQTSASLPSHVGRQIGASIPVRRGCSISIYADGEVTQESLVVLKKYIELIESTFPTEADLKNEVGNGLKLEELFKAPE